MAVDVAERPPPGMQHVPTPARLRREIDQVEYRQLGWGGQAVADVLVSLAEDLQVERQHQGRAAGHLGAVDETVDEVAIAHDVELEPERLIRVPPHPRSSRCSSSRV